MRLFQYLFLAASLPISSLALAEDVHYGMPVYGGNGCPRGALSAVLSPDQKTLSITMDQMLAEAGKDKPTARKRCELSLPIHVPKGISVALASLSFKGYSLLPLGSSSILKVDTFLSGVRGPTYKKTFSAPLNEEYSSNLEAPQEAIWSKCGSDTNLRMSIDLQVSTNLEQAPTAVSAEAIGLIQLQVKRCEETTDSF